MEMSERQRDGSSNRRSSRGQAVLFKLRQETLRQFRDLVRSGATSVVVVGSGKQKGAEGELIRTSRRDSATGRFVSRLATKEGPMLLAEGMNALKARARL